MRLKYFIILLAGVVIGFLPGVNAQLTVSKYNGGTGSGGLPIANLIPFVQSNLIASGAGITVTNASFIGKNLQLGSFNATNTVLYTNYGFDKGIILGTGPVTNAIGPNDQPWAAGVDSYTGDNTDDADLHAVAGKKVKDRSILEFDFTSNWDTISFNFIFGSEEYPEFVNQYNDPFGFFLSGPGISGPFSNSAINLAIVPGTSTPISINTVNNGSSSTGTFVPNCMNCSYYVYNGDPGNGTTVNPYKSNNQYIQYDGYTVMMEAKAVVQCGQTYHIKLAIADARDESYDSGVMLRGNLSTLPQNQNQNVSANCAAGNITLDPHGSAGSTYLWSTGATSPTISISPGVYSGQTISVTITNSCSNIRTVNYLISCPLAVSIEKFDLVNNVASVDINWMTGTEKENDYFEIYRSEDAQSFVRMSTLTGAGNSNVEKQYTYIDSRPLNGLSYYKIGMVDKNGNRTYSEIKSIQRDLTNNTVYIYPNPTNQLTSISYVLPEATHCYFQLLDPLGNSVFLASEYLQKGTKTWQIDASSLARGIYSVSIHTDSGVRISRLIVQ
jgi:hypothetical protein